MTKRGQLTGKMIKNDQKSNKLEGHVEVGRNIRTVVEEISNSKDYQDFDKLT